MPKPLLPSINSPADIKVIAEQDLPQLAQEVRDELVRVLSDDNPTSVGGHLGPNLGVVELTIALHRVADADAGWQADLTLADPGDFSRYGYPPTP